MGYKAVCAAPKSMAFSQQSCNRICFLHPVFIIIDKPLTTRELIVRRIINRDRKIADVLLNRVRLLGSGRTPSPILLGVPPPPPRPGQLIYR